jgi:hypothetical protein
MGTDGASPRLEALHALLTSAQQLAQTLKDDPTLPRLLRALASIPPEERATLASVLERETGARRINEGFAPLNGVRLHVNPNARLFVRVLDGEEPSGDPELEEHDILPEVLRLMQRVPLVLTPEAQAAWRPAVERALDMLPPRGRRACLRFAEDVRALIAARITTEPADPP